MMEAFMQNGHHPAGMMASRTQAYSTALVHTGTPCPPGVPGLRPGAEAGFEALRRAAVQNDGRRHFKVPAFRYADPLGGSALFSTSTNHSPPFSCSMAFLAFFS